MRKVILLYNPIAGKNRERRRTDVEAAAQVLRGSGIEAQPVETQAPGSAGHQAQRGGRRQVMTRSWPAAVTAPSTMWSRGWPAARRRWA